MVKPLLGINQVIKDAEVFRLPRIIAYNRLEARPRTLDFTRSLRAEVRDALWMLTRQWQFGEIAGEDAASCVTSRIAYQHELIDRVSLRDQTGFRYKAETMPLETRVERETIPLSVPATGGDLSDILFAVQLGKQFLRLLRAAALDQHYHFYLERFPIRLGKQDPDADEIQKAIANRIADGIAIWRAVEDGAHDPWIDSQAGADPALKVVAASFADACAKKFQRLFTQPESETDSAWLKNRLEYQFSVAAEPAANESQTVLFAEQYHQGHLDWYSFDVVGNRKIALEEEAETVSVTDQIESFLPANVRFKGQPQPRFWEMEETQTDFGKIETSTTGLLHLLLAEFGLIYSNDWFLLPHPMPVNNVCEIRGIVVDDTFGRHTFIRPAGRGPATAWQRWAMFYHTEKDAGRSSSSRFYLVPGVGKVLESEPLERLNFVRDEMANMVWSVESIVPSQSGKGISGNETAKLNELKPPPAHDDANVKIGYVLGTRVPSNWIPFIAVHVEGSVSEIHLQRARMVGGEQPRGRLLREPKSPYFIEEEEVPRAGIYVERSWQRARWLRGRTFMWIGRRKTAGRGEGWSQLVFDQILDLPEV
jgi:hypothetical protein